MHMIRRSIVVGILGLLLPMMTATFASGSERSKIMAFMQVTGFDVALDSLRLSAGQAPALLGLSEDNFGEDWTHLADEIFESGQMQKDALDILERTIDDEMLNHAAAFYASELGQRLVAAENTAHMDDSEDARSIGEDLVADMLVSGSPRIEYFKDMSNAIGSIDNAIRSITEVQVRFLVAASAAGLTDRELDEADLRALLSSRADEMRQSMIVGSVTNAAYTYRDFSDEELSDYLTALQHPLMQRVYQLMNAIQAQLQVTRFEELAARMVDLYPQQDI